MGHGYESETKSQLEETVAVTSLTGSSLNEATDHAALKQKDCPDGGGVYQQGSHPNEAALCSPADDKASQDKIVTWDGDNDPENPKNFSSTRKWLIVSTTCMVVCPSLISVRGSHVGEEPYINHLLTLSQTFCITFSSSIFTSVVTAAGEDFGVSGRLMLLGVALYVVGFAAGEWRRYGWRYPH